MLSLNTIREISEYPIMKGERNCIFALKRVESEIYQSRQSLDKDLLLKVSSGVLVLEMNSLMMLRLGYDDSRTNTNFC